VAQYSKKRRKSRSVPLLQEEVLLAHQEADHLVHQEQEVLQALSGVVPQVAVRVALQRAVVLQVLSEVALQAVARAVLQRAVVLQALSEAALQVLSADLLSDTISKTD
jgi:hypothetical protein